MKREYIALSAVLFLLCAVVGDLPAAPAGPLADRVEAVTIKGDALPADILNSPIGSYRVFASNGSSIAVIPMQIDERDKDGDILVDMGPRARSGDGKFSAGDELMFMASDAGEPYGGAAPEGCARAVTISLADARTGKTGYVLLAQCDRPPPLSPISYVKYDEKSRTVITDRYRFGWHEAAVYYYDYISIDNGPDLLDRLKVRATIGKLGVKYTFNEEHFKNEFIGFNNGPIRVTWKSVNFWSLGPLGRIPVPGIAYFSREYATLNNPMDARYNPALFGLDLTVIIGHDLILDKSAGYSICTNVAPDCIPYNNEDLARKAQDLVSKDMVWGGVSGPGGALMTHFVLPPKLNARVIGEFIDGLDAKDNPEYVPGCSPFIGFKIVDWKNVKPDIYNLLFYHFFMAKYSKAEFERFDRIVTNQLVIKVK